MERVDQIYIGQRLIFGRHIVVAIDAPRGKEPGRTWFGEQWIRKPDGVEQLVSVGNLERLPNGQL